MYAHITRGKKLLTIKKYINTLLDRTEFKNSLSLLETKIYDPIGLNPLVFAVRVKRLWEALSAPTRSYGDLVDHTLFPNRNIQKTGARTPMDTTFQPQLDRMLI